ncbi:O-acetyl-ADP-ribose deacetylase [Emcibacter sp.]|uniref:O-acetyl-ADP-ribose deacetylase n=1 Tax=Emcibacter sp. TaxID=1979954 RepID=UPI003A8DA325
MEINVLRGDITTLEMDAIVNAANNRLTPGGGVCGAIFQAAGPELVDACQAIGHCNTGEAVITKGFKLPAKHIVHTVGPVWCGGGEDEEEKLASCYRSCLELATKKKLSRLAFPAISTGIYGFPAERAVKIAIETVKTWAEENSSSLKQVIFCCFDGDTERFYRANLQL